MKAKRTYMIYREGHVCGSVAEERMAERNNVDIQLSEQSSNTL